MAARPQSPHPSREHVALLAAAYGSPSALAEVLGIRAETVSAWLAGRQRPGPAYALRLAEMYEAHTQLVASASTAIIAAIQTCRMVKSTKTLADAHFTAELCRDRLQTMLRSLDTTPLNSETHA